jgi:putative Holliday junction resolvase
MSSDVLLEEDIVRLLNRKLPNGRILGIDYGLKRIGVAISDPTRTIVSGLPTISNRGWQKAVQQIITHVNQYNVVAIVIGKPLNMDGSRSTFCDKVDAFIKRLREIVTIPIVEWDERMTSLAAERTLKSAGHSPSKKKEEVDKIAAIFILQSFLDRISADSAQ